MIVRAFNRLFKTPSRGKALLKQYGGFPSMVCGLFIVLILSSAFNAPAHAEFGLTMGLPPINIYYGYALARPQTQTGDQDPTDAQAESQALFKADGTPISPIGRVRIYAASAAEKYVYSADTGEYGLQFYGPPCPGNFYSYRDIITAEYYPDLRPRYPIFMTADTHIPITVSCMGLGALDFGFTLTGLITKVILMDILAGVNTNRVYEQHILMDTMIVMGGVRMTTGEDADNNGSKDVIPVAGETEFGASGHLASISEEDFKDTDIYIFNERTRQIIAHTGLNHFTPGTPGPARTFQVPILGPLYNHVYRVMAEAGQTWTSPSVFPDQTEGIPLAASRARPGDIVTVTAINRATGFVGAKRTELVSIGLDPNEQNEDITMVIIDMEPPHIKVKAQRSYRIKRGDTEDDDEGDDEEDDDRNKKGERRDYLIGSEGTALAGDEVIEITTEWTAADGSLLPVDLPGYIGRISRVVKNGHTAGPDLGQIATFPVRTGVTKQWVYAPNSGIIGDHIYMHLCALPVGDGETCEFGTIRDEDPWRYRPESIVPMKILRHGTRINAQGDTNTTDTDMDGVSNFYEDLLGNDPLKSSDVPVDSDQDGIPDDMWVQRPELHFSVFDLNLQSIRLLEEGETQSINITSDNRPVISWEDQRIDIHYRIRTPDNGNLEALPRFGSPRELEFVFGDKSVMAELDQNDSVSFSDLAQLANAMGQLSPEDYLSLRLLQSSDVGNVLWEWAFRIPVADLDVDSDNNDGTDAPERSKREDEIENIPGNNPEFPGKLLIVHEGDTDGDGLPDFADFTASARFVPVVIEIPEELDIEEGRIRFVYQASDPNGVVVEGNAQSGFTYLPAPGYLRLWTEDGDTNRNKASVVNDGHFVPTNTLFNPEDFELDEDNRELTLYVEAVRWSQSVADIKIELEFVEGP